MDDKQVTKISESEVVTRSAYLLIYQRTHPSYNTPSPVPINQSRQGGGRAVKARRCEA